MMRSWKHRWQLVRKVVLPLFMLWLIIPLFVSGIPIKMEMHGQTFYPLLDVTFSDGIDSVYSEGIEEWRHWDYDQVDWRSEELDNAIWTVIPYNPDQPDPLRLTAQSPLETQSVGLQGELVSSWRHRHWLGTDHLGRDVVAILCYGFHSALSFSFIAVLVSLCIALFFGGGAGFLGNKMLRIGRIHLLMLLPIIFISSFYGWRLHWLFGLLIFAGMNTLAFKLSRVRVVRVPVDSIVSLVTVLGISVPAIIWLLMWSGEGAMNEVSLGILMGVVSWPVFSIVIRSEVQMIKSTDYIESAISQGIPLWRIFAKQIIPNLWPRIRGFFFLGISGAIIVESGLSILGYGLAETNVTWGRLLAEGIQRDMNWWLIVPPVLCIAILSFLMERISTRLKTRAAYGSEGVV